MPFWPETSKTRESPISSVPQTAGPQPMALQTRTHTHTGCWGQRLAATDAQIFQNFFSARQSAGWPNHRAFGFLFLCALNSCGRVSPACGNKGTRTKKSHFNRRELAHVRRMCVFGCTWGAVSKAMVLHKRLQVFVACLRRKISKFCRAAGGRPTEL